jgi:hypothetical protein
MVPAAGARARGRGPARYGREAYRARPREGEERAV